MQGLLRLLIALIVLHGALGLTQMSNYYNLGNRVYYGDSGFLSHTPARHLVDIDYANEDRPAFTNLPAIIDRLTDLGSTINGLVIFEYEMFDYVTAADGIVFNFIIVIRLIGWLCWTWLVIILIVTIFRSNLLGSVQGMVLLGVTGVIGTLSGFDILQRFF